MTIIWTFDEYLLDLAYVLVDPRVSPHQGYGSKSWNYSELAPPYYFGLELDLGLDLDRQTWPSEKNTRGLGAN